LQSVEKREKGSPERKRGNNIENWQEEEVRC
jgi:hypothetical protein